MKTTSEQGNRSRTAAGPHWMRGLLLAALFILAGPLCAETHTADWDVVLMITSDLEGQLAPFMVKVKEDGAFREREVGGFSRLAAAVARIEEKFPGRALLVSSGDDLMGPFFSSYRGEPIYDLMNRLGYDVGTMGNHEFDKGDAYLTECIAHAKFPLVESNLIVADRSPLYGRIPRYVILEAGGLRVGFFGLINRDMTIISRPGPHVAVDTDYHASAREMVTILKEEKVDLIVALAHIGLNYALELATRVPEIDVICAGNAVTLVERGRELVRKANGRDTLVVQPGEKGQYLGVLKLRVAGRRITSHHWLPIQMDERIPKDPEVAALVEEYSRLLPRDMTLARAVNPLDGNRKVLRTAEAPLGNLVADALRERYKTDIAIYNSGGIRGDRVYPAGPLRRSDLQEMFPFGNQVYIGRIPGHVLLQTLERSVSYLPEAAGAFLQVSGLRFKVDVRAPAQELAVGADGKVSGLIAPGKRVTSVEVEGPDGTFQPLDAGRDYSIATGAFLAQGGDGYFMLAALPDWKEADTMVIAVIEEKLLGSAEINPGITGRILFEPAR